QFLDLHWQLPHEYSTLRFCLSRFLNQVVSSSAGFAERILKTTAPSVILFVSSRPHRGIRIYDIP
ncbi:MAG: hypothetical protein QXO25_02670, partial [Candidatus Bathyarchaeia archaeon]